MRVFVAIELPDRVRAEIEGLQDHLTVGRDVPAENLHLTLSFLGEQPDYAVEDAHEALSAIHLPGFELQLAGVGSFGGRLPKVLFVDVAPCRALGDMERRITRSLRNAGLEFQKRRFRPHVTIARLPAHLSALDLDRVRDFLSNRAGFRGSPFRVRSFQLYRSILSPKGAVHEPLARYDLAAL